MSQPTYPLFWTGIEGPHGSAHVWVGGDMGDVMISPHDPTFFLLHCNVDRLWAEWIHAHAGVPSFKPFQPISGGDPGQNLTDAMWPWDGSARPVAMAPWVGAPETVRPMDVLDHRALGYHYDTIDPECQIHKFKFVDDIKLKFRDDIKLKFADHPLKQVGDTIFGPDPIVDPARLARAGLGVSPFVLATPHHAPGVAGSGGQ